MLTFVVRIVFPSHFWLFIILVFMCFNLMMSTFKKYMELLGIKYVLTNKDFLAFRKQVRKDLKISTLKNYKIFESETDNTNYQEKA
jgi:hypothetical protein